MTIRPPDYKTDGPIDMTHCLVQTSARAILGLVALHATATHAADLTHQDILWSETKRHSLGDEELVIRDFFQDERDGFFVDIGCSHARLNSNTFYLEKQLGWSGIGVDGVPDYGKGWARLRPDSTFLNYIVSDEKSASKTFYKVPVWGLSTAEKDVAGRRKGVEEIEVPAITLDEILENQGAKDIDLLSIDVEGHHESVLAGFDLQRWKPRLVCIEEEGPYAVPWFRARGYEPILRYRERDSVNWYFAPASVAADTDAKISPLGKTAMAERAKRLAAEPPGSPVPLYLLPQYILDENRIPVLNPRWVAAAKALEDAQRASPETPTAKTDSEP